MLLSNKTKLSYQKISRYLILLITISYIKILKKEFYSIIKNKLPKWTLLGLFLISSNVTFGGSFFSNIYDNIREDIFDQVKVNKKTNGLIFSVNNENLMPPACNINPINLALVGTASASSEAFGGYAAAGIDGDITNTNIHHSASETDPWWEVDLGSEQTVGRIVFWNRNGQETRANGIIIEVLNASNVVQFSTTFATPGTEEIAIAPGVEGQIVRLRLVGANKILNFNEVQVFGGEAPKAYAIQASCVDEVVGNDAYLSMSDITYGDAFHYSIGNTFDDNGGTNTYANAQSIIGSTVETAHVLPNPVSSTVYTIRLYNGSNVCFEDIQVTLNPQDCTIGCNCTEYIYLNETTNGGAVHKFSIATDGVMTEVGGVNG